ncbi:MAG: phosphoribosylformylglycinamidine cyclo-ligase [Nitrospirae bacterium]|nr:phosphoribosylformylglycinamidine cyclo-ligase [Nitrospirota bacterium]
MALTYKKSGVDIAEGDKLVDIIKPLAHSTFIPGVLNDIGSFGAFFGLKQLRYKDPVLVSGTDGVGTKLKIAFMLNRHDTVGIDLVAMSVNDLLTSGARPLFFLDYFASGKLSTKVAADVIRGIADGCKTAGCSLIGGETAEMPGFYSAGEYDLAGFAVGIAERKEIIDGSKIKEGDIIIGLSSSGLHSNGYSLARKLFFEIKKYNARKKIKELGCSVGDELLKPTRIYVKSILEIISKFKVKGMAHITGGGITENLPRILPEKKNLKAVIERGSWPVHKIFSIMQNEGNVSEDEMYRTFNMGIGFMLVVNKDDTAKIIKRLNSLGEKAFVIGQIEKGRGGVKYV